jgi:hypothetical protein
MTVKSRRSRLSDCNGQVIQCGTDRSLTVAAWICLATRRKIAAARMARALRDASAPQTPLGMTVSLIISAIKLYCASVEVLEYVSTHHRRLSTRGGSRTAPDRLSGLSYKARLSTMCCRRSTDHFFSGLFGIRATLLTHPAGILLKSRYRQKDDRLESLSYAVSSFSRFPGSPWCDSQSSPATSRNLLPFQKNSSAKGLNPASHRASADRVN